MKAFYLILLIASTTAINAAAQGISGTWVRYDETETPMEIFIIRSNGNFMSDVLYTDGQLRMVERGTYRVKGDSIRFTFKEIISHGKSGWKAQLPSTMRNFSAWFKRTGSELKIGRYTYQKED